MLKITCFILFIILRCQSIDVSTEEEFVDALQSRNTIELVSDIQLSATLEIVGLVDILIDGRGHAIDGKLSSTKCISVYSSSNITLSNTHIMRCLNSYDFEGGGIALISSSVTLVRVNITSCVVRDGRDYGAGAAIHVAGKSRLVMSHCMLALNVASIGGAVYVAQATGYVHAVLCIFINNRAVTTGGIAGGIYALGSLKLEGCTFEENFADGFGGALFVSGGLEPTTLFADSCVFHRNEASVAAAVYLEAAINANVRSCSFSENSSVSSVLGGSAIRVSDGATLVASSSIFNGNTALSSGAVYVVSRGIATFTGCTFSGNIAQSSTQGGGAITSDSLASVTLVGCALVNNTARMEGGAIWSLSSLVLAGCFFLGNSALADMSSSDVFITTGRTISDYSLCPANEYNTGQGSLMCDGCASTLPADLFHGTCESCNANTFSCCGSLQCEISAPQCSPTEISLCASPTNMPSQTPSGSPTQFTWFPSIAPTTPTPPPSFAPSDLASTLAPSQTETSPPSGAIPRSLETSWFLLSYPTVLIVNVFIATAVAMLLAVSSKYRSKKGSSLFLLIYSVLSVMSAGIEMTFCYSMTLCRLCPRHSGIALPLASTLVCAPAIAYCRFRWRDKLDKCSIYYSAPVLFLATFEGDMAIWLPWRETLFTPPLSGFIDRSVLAFSCLSLISRKVPVCMWMALKTESAWRNIACVVLCSLSIILSLSIKLQNLEKSQDSTLFRSGSFEVPNYATEPALPNDAIGDGSPAPLIDGHSHLIMIPFEDFTYDEDADIHELPSSDQSDVADVTFTEGSFGNLSDASSDAYGIGSSLGDLKHQDVAHVPYARHSFPGTSS